MGNMACTPYRRRMRPSDLIERMGGWMNGAITRYRRPFRCRTAVEVVMVISSNRHCLQQRSSYSTTGVRLGMAAGRVKPDAKLRFLLTAREDLLIVSLAMPSLPISQVYLIDAYIPGVVISSTYSYSLDHTGYFPIHSTTHPSMIRSYQQLNPLGSQIMSMANLIKSLHDFLLYEKVLALAWDLGYLLVPIRGFQELHKVREARQEYSQVRSH